MQSAIFLDRDGVLIENRADYVLSWKDVSFYPQALTAMDAIGKLPHKIVIVTNQSAIGRGLITLENAQALNDKIVKVVEEAGGRVDKVYMCPHTPWEECECRKPKPGLLLQAADEISLDLRQSIMIGDAITDLVAAEAANVGQIALVRTGRGAEQEILPEAEQLKSLNIYASLTCALEDFFPTLDFPKKH